MIYVINPHIPHEPHRLILKMWNLNRRKFRSQTSDNMDKLKAEMERVREKRRIEERRSEKRKSQKKEDAGARKGRKVAVVARSTFRSQNAQNTPASDHFWKLRCRKSARRCGTKHISKSKCTKHTSSGPLLEVEMSKKCTPLWREAHFEVNMYKTPQVRATFRGSDVV